MFLFFISWQGLKQPIPSPLPAMAELAVFKLVMNFIFPQTPGKQIVPLADSRPAYQGLSQTVLTFCSELGRMRAVRRNPGLYDREVQAYLNRCAFRHVACFAHHALQNARLHLIEAGTNVGITVDPLRSIGETWNDMPENLANAITMAEEAVEDPDEDEDAVEDPDDDEEDGEDSDDDGSSTRLETDAEEDEGEDEGEDMDDV